MRETGNHEKTGTMLWWRHGLTVTAVAMSICVLFLISCAKQGYPPGGPEDKIPPALEISSPESGAIHVSRTDPVILAFTETMDVKSIEDNLFIVPIPASWPRFKWRSRDRELEIQFNEPLEENATYVITVGSKARDLRRNELDNSIMLSFSTGDKIESGAIAGTVIPVTFIGEKIESATGVDVAAYRLDGASGPDPRHDVPDYVTQSGSDGSYEMIGLSSGTYRLFAIGDLDRNGFYSEGYDLIGVASRDITLASGDSLVYAPDIPVASRDTSSVQLLSISVPDKRRAELFFDRPVVSENASVVFDVLEVRDMYVPADRASVLSVITDEQEEGRRYSLSSLNVTDSFGNSLLSLGVVPTFVGTDVPDTTALSVVAYEPGLLTPGGDAVHVQFNRALSMPDEPDELLLPKAMAEMTVSMEAPDILKIQPRAEWEENREYRIAFDTGRIRGVTGNSVNSDTLEVAFRVVAADTLGFIEGDIEDELSSENAVYRLQFKNIDFKTHFEMDAGTGGQWSTGAVLPGRYLVRAFRDDDGDGRLFAGTFEPYRTGEPVASIADTIVVVSRWTNGDNTITFR